MSLIMSCKNIFTLITPRVKQNATLFVQHRRPYSLRQYERPHLELVKDIILYVTSHRYPLLPLKAEFTLPVEDQRETVWHPFSENFCSTDGKWEFSVSADEEEIGDIKAVKSSLLFYKGNQEVRLKKVCDHSDDMSESDVAAVFANHLFCQLIPSQTNYYLDLKSKGKTANCPCGCGEILNFGVSQLGSRKLFYGSADLVVFPLDEDVYTDTNNGHKCTLFTLNKGHNDIEEELYTNEEFPDEEWSAEECKLASLRKQIYKQSISMSLCKHNRLLQQAGVSDISITPVCGFNGNSYTVAIYDAEHDYLLKMAGNLEMFEDVYLKSSAILDIWLLIHHHIFCSKPPQSVQKQLEDSCGLKHILGHQMYEHILLDSNWRYDSYRPFKTREISDEIDRSKFKFMDENIDFNSDAKQLLKDRLPKRLVRDL